MNVSISVIIPVYNAEKFLCRSVDSLLNQTRKDFEIILVDDGSTDNSGIICDKYASQYKNIRVVRRKNGGLSAARNTGVSAARNEYILFLDSDDFLDKDAIEKIEDVINCSAPDCICYGWRYITTDGPQQDAIPNLKKDILLNRQHIHENVLPSLLNLKKDDGDFIYDFAWNKVYKRSILGKYSVQFDETRRIWEDRPFVVEYLKYCDSFYCMDRALYNYVQVAGSLSSKFYLNFFDIILENYQNYVKWYGDEYNFDTEYANTYWCNSIENMVFRSLRQNENTEVIRERTIIALSNPQVRYWYAHRTAQNAWQKRAGELETQGKYQELIDLYKNQLDKQVKQERKADAIRKVKFCIRKLLRR